jgi:DnaJ like chaperone protein
MRVIGKIIGASTGFFLAGPFGALAGVALGHQLLDQPPREFFGVPMSEREVKNSVFFAATFAMLGKLAQADGRVSESELAAIKNIIENKFNLSRRSADFAYKTFTAAIEDDLSFASHARAFHSQFTNAPEALTSMLETMLVLAHADFEYDDSEESLIKSAAQIFGLQDEYPTILALFQSQPDSLEHCYLLLGVNIDDSDEVLAARVQHLLREHDPELLIQEGVPRELANLSSEKHEQIQQAYKTIQQARASQETVVAT